MQLAHFNSRDPLNHVQRVLAILQRMGFVLDSISVCLDTDGRSTVKSQYFAAGGLSVETFIARVAELHGIEDLEHGTVVWGLEPRENVPFDHIGQLTGTAI